MPKPTTILIIDGERYDVTNYKHPGEGIRGIYLREQKGDKSEDFEYYHMTDEPWEILEKAREKGEYKGVKYLSLNVKNNNNK